MLSQRPSSKANTHTPRQISYAILFQATQVYVIIKRLFHFIRRGHKKLSDQEQQKNAGQKGWGCHWSSSGMGCVGLRWWGGDDGRAEGRGGTEVHTAHNTLSEIPIFLRSRRLRSSFDASLLAKRVSLKANILIKTKNFIIAPFTCSSLHIHTNYRE